jgi:hypothetical protein
MTAPAVHAPDLVERVIGYRHWRLDDAGLWSPYLEERWGRGVHTATCRADRGAHAEPAPAHDCTCGIHAWYQAPPMLSWAATRNLVAGAVALWGELELHPFGMRAQHGMVVALALPPWRGTKPRRIAEVAAELEIDAVPARALEAAARAYGAPVPPAFIPQPEKGRAAYAVEQHMVEAAKASAWRNSALVSRTRSPD